MTLQNIALRKGKEVAGHNVSQQASGGENVLTSSRYDAGPKVEDELGSVLMMAHVGLLQIKTLRIN